MLSWLRRVIGPESSTPYGAGDRVALVQEVLGQLEPLLALDGGRIELVGVGEDGVVEVRLKGACESCSASATTLHGALEPALAARAAWFRSVRAS